MVLRMLQKYPADRYPDWAELALDLARIGRLSVYDQVVRDSEKFLSLRPAALLAQFSDAEVWELTRIGQWRRVPSQTVLVGEGECRRQPARPRAGRGQGDGARPVAERAARGRLLRRDGLRAR